MNFSFEEWTLKKLIEIYDSKKLNLNPPYQRGDIWTLPAKKKLIDSIKLDYPLPAFFLYLDGNNYEMVDGQQRTRTILGYSKGLFPDLNKIKIDKTDQSFFFEKYKISICLIKEAKAQEIEDFYYRVNKFGTKLNRPEIIKSQYANTNLQNLVEKIADSSNFDSLNLFTDKNLDRLNDLDFVAELLTLTRFGITERKFTVDKFYEDKDFNVAEAEDLEKRFNKILSIIHLLNQLYPIKNTRYKQRADFYTLFSFLSCHPDLNQESIEHFYKILVLIGDDISPSQEKCFALQEYAINCVSLSHTEKARKMRLNFFEQLLLNQDPTPLISERNLILMDIMIFYHLLDSDLENHGLYKVIGISKLQNVTGRNIF
ncbi:MAG: DUF262 domain-containing protein [Bacteroidetes bacterium]|nr:DUF262 domain-containing protein [Bacteroidota bacterium]